ncbi:MAG: hypothetical protein JXR70_17990 [Spirochaetales bacterium]|nr:hypothetical protein [Spirochaetales bacterium]
MDFDKAYLAGKRKTSFLWIKRKAGYLLSLKELLALVPAIGESYTGIKDVPVEKIIGSENRSEDFAEGFLPIQGGMKFRWENVRKLFLEAQIADAIDLIEYGGCYFVRDGNHRVSVAKTNDIDYVTASIQTMKTPVKLPRRMSRKKIPLFIAKARFQAETSVFDYIPEEDFDVAIADNWDYLKKDIFEYSPNWYKRNHGKVPDKKTVILNWYHYIYRTAMEFIKNNHLPFLYPQKNATDIFCDLIRLWNSYPDTDALWVMEVYNLYLKKALNGSLLLRPLRGIRKAWDYFFMTKEEARRYFLSVCNFNELMSEAVLPEGDKNWYRFLSDFILIENSRHLRNKMKEETGRFPVITEVLTQSYHLFLKPAYDVYLSHKCEKEFPVLFKKWMLRYGRGFLKKGQVLSAEKIELSFRNYILKKSKKMIKNPI